MNSQSIFSDSNDNSGSSSICNISNHDTPPSPENSKTPELTALKRLSDNLESIFDSSEYDFCSDAKLVLSNSREIPIHRCILAARSPFFKKKFANPSDEEEKGGKFQLKNLTKEFEMGLEIGFDSLGSVLAYLYSGKVKPLPRGICVCVDEECLHVGCRPAVDFMVEVLYASCIFEISELVTLFQRRLLDVLDKVAADDILVILAVAYVCRKACERLVTECIDVVTKSDIDPTSLEKSLPHDVAKQIIDTRAKQGLGDLEPYTLPNKHIKRMHRALDSDDVELVGMLLKEGHTSLDEACALHYAVAYCNVKTTKELLDLALADINHKNARGYTVLHIAAMRKEPTIIVSLLTKGARPTDLTADGRKALHIAMRLTKSVDYIRSTEKGQASPNDRLCIEILEQAERRDPLPGEASLSLAVAGDDQRLRLLYLENRVCMAKLLFPREAQVAMDIAKVAGTLEFSSSTCSRKLQNLNEAPFVMEQSHLDRMTALSKTVELGKRYFPRCSDVLNKIMADEDLSELADTGNDDPHYCLMKKRRFTELQETFGKAFNADKVEYDKRIALSSSSSSTSRALARNNGRMNHRK